MLQLTNMKSAPKRRSKAAQEKLGDLPFNTIAEQKAFRDKIRLQALTHLETAKAMEELTQLPDYAFFKKKFEQGMRCRLVKEIAEIVHVYMNDTGIQVDVSEEANSADESEVVLIGTLIRSLCESLIKSYYLAFGYLPVEGQTRDKAIETFLAKNFSKGAGTQP